MRKKHRNFRVSGGLGIGVNTETGEIALFSQEDIEQHGGATPLLTEEEMIKALRRVLLFLSPAQRIRELEDPGKYHNFTYEELHEIGHIVCLMLMMFNRQPLRQTMKEDPMFLCDFLKELGL